MAAVELFLAETGQAPQEVEPPPTLWNRSRQLLRAKYKCALVGLLYLLLLAELIRNLVSAFVFETSQVPDYIPPSSSTSPWPSNSSSSPTPLPPL